MSDKRHNEWTQLRVKKDDLELFQTLKQEDETNSDAIRRMMRSEMSERDVEQLFELQRRQLERIRKDLDIIINRINRGDDGQDSVDTAGDELC